MSRTPRILLVDDTPLNLEALEAALKSDQYAMDSAEDGLEAWEILNRDPHYQAVLLDLMMPRLDGMSLLLRLKADDRFRHLPVILQTADPSPDRVAEGIQAGAFYYLVKPLHRQVLRSVVRAAVEERIHLEEVLKDADARARSADLLKRAEFVFRTPEDARALSALLIRVFPDPERVSLGIWELLVNAVEHGNLEISYAEKTELIHDQRLAQEVEARLAQPAYQDRRARVWIERDAGGISLTVEDEGPGFDWSKYLELSPERAFHTHGRGIAMARQISFDELEYEGRGNRVVARVLK